MKTKKERLLERLQEAEGEEKTKILARLVVIDEEVAGNARDKV